MYNNPPELRGLKTEDFFFAKNAPKPGSFWATNGQNLALSSRKWHKKNLIDENGGERKINPSANPVYDLHPTVKAKKKAVNSIQTQRITSQLRTGYCYLNGYMHTVGLKDSPPCTCGEPESVNTT